MSEHLSRRNFMIGTAAAYSAVSVNSLFGNNVAAGATGNQKSCAAKDSRLQKAILYGMLPDSLSHDDRFKMFADLGFDGVEVGVVEDEKIAGQMRVAADKAGIRIHSVMNGDGWNNPLSDSDREVADKGLEALRKALRVAKIVGADTVLQIPAIVTPKVRYKDAWKRSQRELRKVLPLAHELKITIAIENVGNRFLLSPLEFARYVDEMNDPYLQAYFDVGNSLFLWGYPQDWILTLGRRIKKIHLKDCNLTRKRWTMLRDGDVDWPAVYQAIQKINYNGFLTFEGGLPESKQKSGYKEYVGDISKRMDLILQGK